MIRFWGEGVVEKRFLDCRPHHCSFRPVYSPASCAPADHGSNFLYSTNPLFILAKAKAGARTPRWCAPPRGRLRISVRRHPDCERRKADRVGRRFIYFFLATLSAVVLISFFAAAGREYVAIPYAYLVAGSPMLLAGGYVMWRYPRLIPKFVKTAAFFFALFLVYELIALHLGQWEFRGEYIGWVQLWGARFPLEEFFYWMIVYTLFELSIYEGAIDDGR